MKMFPMRRRVERPLFITDLFLDVRSCTVVSELLPSGHMVQSQIHIRRGLGHDRPRDTVCASNSTWAVQYLDVHWRWKNYVVWRNACCPSSEQEEDLWRAKVVVTESLPVAAPKQQITVAHQHPCAHSRIDTLTDLICCPKSVWHGSCAAAVILHHDPCCLKRQLQKDWAIPTTSLLPNRSCNGRNLINRQWRSHARRHFRVYCMACMLCTCSCGISFCRGLLCDSDCFWVLTLFTAWTGMVLLIR